MVKDTMKQWGLQVLMVNMKNYIKGKVTGTCLEPLARKVWGRYTELRRKNSAADMAECAPVKDISGPRDWT